MPHTRPDRRQQRINEADARRKAAEALVARKAPTSAMRHSRPVIIEGPTEFDLKAWIGRPRATDWEQAILRGSGRRLVKGSRAMSAYRGGWRLPEYQDGPHRIRIQASYEGHRCTRPAVCELSAQECMQLV